jgi:hypothetical protein
MAAAPPPEGELAPDEAMTAARQETKYLVARDRLQSLVGELSRHLVAHHYAGEGANRLPNADHFVTTIYFDTQARALFSRARQDPDHNEKLRAKEYHDLHPSLAELATDLAQIVRYQPWLWFELKRRDHDLTEKRRFRLRKPDVPSFFAAAYAQQRVSAEGAPHILQHIVDYCSGLGAPLAASSLVNYRRLSFQDAGAKLRVTIDCDLTFHAPPADLWSRTSALVRGTLGPVRRREPKLVLEVKRRAGFPSWLHEALARCDAQPSSYSKFVRAEEAVHGEP